MAALAGALLGVVDLDLLIFVHSLHDLFQILALEVAGRTMLSRHDLCPEWLIPNWVFKPLYDHSGAIPVSFSECRVRTIHLC
jgi:hypothetical protein